MRRILTRVGLLLLAALAVVPGSANAAELDILERLRALPGVTVVAERPALVPGARFFLLQVEQPADHATPAGPRFQQRAALLYRSDTAPTVLMHTGYGLSTYRGATELDGLLGANRLTLEHRFFGTSRPASNDHALLDIRQSAGDSHRVVQTFRPLLTGRWANTGGSKGGMTSVFHRYFYPDDVDATVAYVAPISFGPSDNRYVRFVDTVGDAECRARLATFQRTVLERRERLEPVYFDTFGPVPFAKVGFDRALETAVLELPFVFWQYLPPAACAFVPSPDASDVDVLMFVEGVSPASGYSDGLLDFYGAYFFQAATQLGYPRVDTSYLQEHVRYPQHDVPAVFASAPVTGHYDNPVAHQVASWVWQHGHRMLFINGELDPWSTTPYRVHAKADGYTFTVPGANHGSAAISSLRPEDRAVALERLGTWMNVDLGGSAARLSAASVTGRSASDVLPAYDVSASNPRRMPSDE
jgi:hypothetical protein